ncbi:response regulator transcription factor [Vagococcus sp. BWB3-3]|uniref:Response regulator transcription factor n=1 Tax=Vagococcus allomyrinae TaxID=2794353 RepID=A0A940PFF9_9ENTE|nr:response regulator transcription factor [Vagococcus allomyrinae]MBP1042993.1 response regulator transcription factor [Vagococcus allomyrinae]
MIRVLVADDHVVVRKGLSYLINDQPDMEVVGTVADGIEAYIEVEAKEPDVVVMDLSMPPGENGLVTTKRIKEKFPTVKVVILSMHDDEDYVLQAIKAGADGYVLKSSDDQEIIKGIRGVQQQYYLDQQIPMQDHLLSQLSGNRPVTETSYQQLSNREQEVLPLVALGYANREIAERLFISVKTVEVHKANIMKKLALANRVELIRYAVKEKIIDL